MYPQKFIQQKFTRLGMQSAAFCLGLWLIATGPFAGAVDRFVGLQGSNQNTGLTRATAWKTLAHAFGNLNPGDVLTVLPGDYVLRNDPGHTNGRINIHRFGGVTIQGNDSTWTTIRADTPGTVNITGHIVFQGSYIRLQDLTIFGDSQNDEPGILGFDAHHIDILYCEVSNCRGGGINFAHSDSLRLIGNATHHNAAQNPAQHSGISIYQPIRWPDAEQRYWNIYLGHNFSYANYNGVMGAIGITDGNGIILDDSKYTQVGSLNAAHRQRIAGATRYPGRTLIEGNMCNYNGGSGVQIHQSAGATVKNNTCVGNRHFAFLANWHYLNQGQVALTHSLDNHVLNNVLVSDAVVHAFGYGGAPYAASDYDGANNFWEANLLYYKVATSILTDNPATFNRAISVNPQFANEAVYDYRSLAGRGRGVSWTGHVYYDIFGTVVPSGGRNDLGAIQNP
ncbi:MAG: right-handed parallel beta-helix repeat-containing protein [Pirellulaceae bacterium]|nr:right-handed parallel beta-helix repeat-containing protein [Pirellulaceae bacterium]